MDMENVIIKTKLDKNLKIASDSVSYIAIALMVGTLAVSLLFKNTVIYLFKAIDII